MMLFNILAAFVLGEQSWENTEQTTMLWQSIHGGKEKEQQLASLAFATNGAVLDLRSEDGRGGLWWAWEFENDYALAMYLFYQHDIERTDATDKEGDHPVAMCKKEGGISEDELKEKAQKRVPQIKEQLADYIKQMEEMKKAQEEAARKKKEKEDKEDEEEIEEDVDPSKDPFAKVKDDVAGDAETKDVDEEKEREEAKKEEEKKKKEKAEAEKKKKTKSIMDDDDDDLSGPVRADDDM
jgi:hypothetical protein